MADKYGDVAIDVLSRKKIHSNVCDYKDEIYWRNQSQPMYGR